MSDPVPHDWTISTIIELGNYHKDAVQTGPFGAQLHADDYVNEGVPLILIKNIKDYGLDDSDIPKITEEDAKRLTRYRLKVGDIVFSRVGRVGSCFLTTEREEGWVISGQTLRMRTDATKVAPKYLLYALRTEKLQRSLVGESVGSTRTSINTTILENLEVNVPPLPEQQKIAAILTSVDNVIESTSAQINKLQDLKTGMMQELLTRGIGHSEFKDSPVGRIPVGWDVKPLGEVAEFINGNSFKASDWRESGVPIIRIQNLNGNPDFNYFDGEIHDKWFVDTNTLLFAWSGQRGKSFGARIWKGQPGVLNQHIFKVVPVDDSIQKYFLLLKLQQVQVDIERHAHGFKDSFMHVKKSDLTVQDVAIPSPAEQTKIVSMIGSVSDKLELTESKLDRLKSTKKALMQDLLTGKVRVKTD